MLIALRSPRSRLDVLLPPLLLLLPASAGVAAAPAAACGAEEACSERGCFPSLRLDFGCAPPAGCCCCGCWAGCAAPLPLGLVAEVAGSSSAHFRSPVKMRAPPLPPLPPPRPPPRVDEPNSRGPRALCAAAEAEGEAAGRGWEPDAGGLAAGTGAACPFCCSFRSVFRCLRLIASCRARSWVLALVGSLTRMVDEISGPRPIDSSSKAAASRFSDYNRHR